VILRTLAINMSREELACDTDILIAMFCYERCEMTVRVRIYTSKGRLNYGQNGIIRLAIQRNRLIVLNLLLYTFSSTSIHTERIQASHSRQDLSNIADLYRNTKGHVRVFSSREDADLLMNRLVKPVRPTSTVWIDLPNYARRLAVSSEH